MKRYLLLAATMIVSACTVPQTAAEFASFMSVSEQTIQIDRSFSAVSASLRAGADKCLNKTEQGWVRHHNMDGFGAMQTSQRYLTTAFSTEIATASGELQITMRKRSIPDQMYPEGYIWLLIEATSVDSGTSLSVHEARLGGDNIAATIQSWAKGGALICPTLNL